jgi:hypothetical protein
LKPAAISKSVWVLLVVSQPAVNANRAMTPIILNEVRICFIILRSFGFAVVLEMISSARVNSRRSFAAFLGSAYKTLVQYVRVAERTAEAQLGSTDPTRFTAL